MKREALLIIDAQKDFGEKGAPLYVNEGELIVPVINELISDIKERAGIIIASRDGHPEDHSSFLIWPKHCVQNTRGAEYMDGLNIGLIDYEVKKGYRSDKDSYSAFGGFEFRGEYPLRDLNQILIDNEIRVLKIVGLATDYCVKATVLDALAAGYEVEVIADGIRAVNINPDDGKNAIEEMLSAGAKIF